MSAAATLLLLLLLPPTAAFDAAAKVEVAAATAAFALAAGAVAVSVSHCGGPKPSDGDADTWKAQISAHSAIVHSAYQVSARAVYALDSCRQCCRVTAISSAAKRMQHCGLEQAFPHFVHHRNVRLVMVVGVVQVMR